MEFFIECNFLYKPIYSDKNLIQVKFTQKIHSYGKVFNTSFFVCCKTFFEYECYRIMYMYLLLSALEIFLTFRPKRFSRNSGSFCQAA